MLGVLRHTDIACLSCSVKELSYSKEGVFLRNIIAAPISDHFTVGPPGSRVREVGLFQG